MSRPFIDSECDRATLQIADVTAGPVEVNTTLWGRGRRAVAEWLTARGPAVQTARTGALSLQGPYRACNEDACYVDARSGLLLVVDGMGGYRGGLEATDMVLSTARRVFSVFADRAPHDLAEVQEAVNLLVSHSRRRMLQHCGAHPECSQMGVTFSLVIAAGDQIYSAHMGDSRAYHVTRRAIEPLTKDETVVQALVDAGLLEPHEVQQHPLRHLLANSLGVRAPERWPHVRVKPCQPGDRLLLTSDGITSVLADRDLHRLVRRGRDPQQTAAALCAEALRRGSRDNVTCVLMDL